MTLTDLKRLTLAATPRTGRLNCIREDCFCPECALQIAVPAERVLAMCAVIEAAKFARIHLMCYSAFDKFDVAIEALDKEQK